MNWDDPAARLALIERVGHAEYNRQIKAHQDASVVATVNGYPIRPVGSQFGRLFAVGGTDMAFSTLPQAEAYAKAQPTRTK
jgi:hypothetical protein